MISQHARILNALKKNGKHGIKNSWFHQHHILCHTARISELRAEGYTIVAEQQRDWRGKATGTFKYFLRDDT